MSEPETVSVAEEADIRPAAAGCALCSRTLTPEITCTVNGQVVCTSCAEQIQREVRQQNASGHAYLTAAIGGLIGALVGAAIWATIVVLSNYEVGYVAVLVGFLTGVGVKLGARRSRSKQLQILAAALSVVGLIAAKYFIFAHIAAKLLTENGVTAGYFHPLILQEFTNALGSMLSPFDLLWLFLAVGAAYRVPAPSVVNVQI